TCRRCVDGERGHRAMVRSELPISVLFYGRDGTHLFALTNGQSGSDTTSISCGSAVQSGWRRPVEVECFPRRTQMTQRMERMDWHSFENSVKTEARSRTASGASVKGDHAMFQLQQNPDA